MNDRSKLAKHGAILPASFGGDGVRRRILEGALRLFARRGFDGSSMRDLAAQIELQPSAMYAHFASKEHLLAELVRAGHEAHHEEIRTAMLDAGADPIAQLAALVRANVRMHTTYPELAIIVNSELERLSPELAAPGLALRKQSAAMLIAVIERGTAKGCFSQPDAQVVAAAIGAIGVRIPHWYKPELMAPGDLAELHVQLVLRMVGAPEGRV
ncbi:MAG: TetR/AcrR family transcriptional regulator [Deltaproteobacteria bacterium]